jgi:hypothetical protein
MRQVITILLIWTIGQCDGGTFDPDTIDNWQIYNGTELVLGGHDSAHGTMFQGIIKESDLKQLTIQFNHCVRYTEGFEVIVEIDDDRGKNILTKKFTAGEKMTIDKKELAQLATKFITIRYREKRKDGTDRILGRISFA